MKLRAKPQVQSDGVGTESPELAGWIPGSSPGTRLVGPLRPCVNGGQLRSNDSAGAARRHDLVYYVYYNTALIRPEGKETWQNGICHRLTGQGEDAVLSVGLHLSDRSETWQQRSRCSPARRYGRPPVATTCPAPINSRLFLGVFRRRVAVSLDEVRAKGPKVFNISRDAVRKKCILPGAADNILRPEFGPNRGQAAGNNLDPHLITEVDRGLISAPHLVFKYGVIGELGAPRQRGPPSWI
ncbi:hypothetical protein J6590_016813 [Homalodisca vitripennis]|nr:hypothetical protein J6590_016813 [Homalodisca vitripennis]